MEIITSPPWLGWPIWNIYVTSYDEYVPLVVSTSRSYPHSRLITTFVTRLIPRVPLVEQELFTHLVSSKCPTFIFLLVIGVEQFLNYPTFLMHFSDLIVLLWQLISIKNPQYIILFLCICILVFIILYLKTWFEYC